MTELAKLVGEYGPGVVALVIVFGGFIYYVRSASEMQDKYMGKQVEALKELAGSNNNVAEALAIIKETFVDRMGVVENKVDRSTDLIKTHCVNTERIESHITLLSTSILKTEERTKACIERRLKDGK
jgi:hypothetical protein